jgi:hypothetical protein
MLKNFWKELKKSYKKIKNRNFYKKINAEKNRLYVR